MAAFAGSNCPSITVRVGSNQATWTCPVTPNGGSWTYTLDSDVVLPNGVGTLLKGKTKFQKGGDPFVFADFGLHLNGPGTVFVDSGLLTFTSITDPQAYATAGITLTAGADPLTEAGSYAGGTKAYQATYNGGNVFAQLVPTLTAAPTTTNTISDRFPLTDTVIIPGSVSSIEGQFSFFAYAAGDVSGTSRFEVTPQIPEFGSLSLALCAGLPAVAARFLRRRRSA